jgi:hypothetical protein
MASVDQGDTGERLVADDRAHAIQLEFLRPPGSRRSFVLLPIRTAAQM